MANTQRDQPAAQDDDVEINVTHFIPSVQLKGTRAEKLATLDLLIDHLEGLRRSLNEPLRSPRVWDEQAPMQLTRSDRWWAAGLFVMAALVFVMLGVRGCATVQDDGFSAPPPATGTIAARDGPD